MLSLARTVVFVAFQFALFSLHTSAESLESSSAVISSVGEYCLCVAVEGNLSLKCSEMSHSQNMVTVFLACSLLEKLSLGSSLILQVAGGALSIESSHRMISFVGL